MTRSQVEPTPTASPTSLANRFARVIWGCVQATLFRLSPRPCHRWRALLLRLFGAKLDTGARVYPKAKIWAPWNLRMGERATIADDVDCYCYDTITIGPGAIISQYTYLCGATHEFELVKRPLIPMPITIGRGVWVAADVFVGPGVTIGEYSVVGARSSVFTDLPAWKVCVGSPARPVRDRVFTDGPEETRRQPAAEARGEP
ncbi:MAG: hypothetical protein WD114_05965 [Phycisphaerales bacterium]